MVRQVLFDEPRRDPVLSSTRTRSQTVFLIVLGAGTAAGVCG
jgi:hypothetical protein